MDPTVMTLLLIAVALSLVSSSLLRVDDDDAQKKSAPWMQDGDQLTPGAGDPRCIYCRSDVAAGAARCSKCGAWR